LIADNGLNLLSTPTDAGAAEAFRRAADAYVAVDPTSPRSGSARALRLLVG
jgi:hypothetical protein